MSEDKNYVKILLREYCAMKKVIDKYMFLINYIKNNGECYGDKVILPVIPIEIIKIIEPCVITSIKMKYKGDEDE